LVLLAGRCDQNRPLLAIHRPAPIQVSMHDPATSGLQEMDYLLADRGMVPRNSAERFTERVACLPTFYVHPPLDLARQSPAPPVAKNGWITFGSFNNPAKINEDVVALWAQILSRVPVSRLLLKYFDAFSIPTARSRYLQLFRKYGISEDRLSLSDQPADAREDHLARYKQIDIALDPFPYNGTTTTFEALGMGVPVVTLLGESMVARMSVAMLTKIGLPQLIAQSQAAYIEIARELASHPEELSRLRSELPNRVTRSPLCAEQARARQLERLYRRMWKIWLARQTANTDMSPH
jgi:predicted O-linked N-acetylglucosamine transferase (SPINDLY family)